MNDAYAQLGPLRFTSALDRIKPLALPQARNSGLFYAQRSPSTQKNHTNTQNVLTLIYTIGVIHPSQQPPQHTQAPSTQGKSQQRKRAVGIKGVQHRWQTRWAPRYRPGQARSFKSRMPMSFAPPRGASPGTIAPAGTAAALRGIPAVSSRQRAYTVKRVRRMRPRARTATPVGIPAPPAPSASRPDQSALHQGAAV